MVRSDRGFSEAGVFDLDLDGVSGSVSGREAVCNCEP